MGDERKYNQEQRKEALSTIEDISSERKIKGNANVSAGRYGELVANMVRYTQAEMTLDLLDKEDTKQSENTVPLYYNVDKQNLPNSQDLEPETLRGQNIINPT